jgi:hypothetical protein
VSVVAAHLTLAALTSSQGRVADVAPMAPSARVARSNLPRDKGVCELCSSVFGATSVARR